MLLKAMRAACKSEQTADFRQRHLPVSHRAQAAGMSTALRFSSPVYEVQTKASVKLSGLAAPAKVAEDPIYGAVDAGIELKVCMTAGIAVIASQA